LTSFVSDIVYIVYQVIIFLSIPFVNKVMGILLLGTHRTPKDYAARA